MFKSKNVLIQYNGKIVWKWYGIFIPKNDRCVARYTEVIITASFFLNMSLCLTNVIILCGRINNSS